MPENKCFLIINERCILYVQKKVKRGTYVGKTDNRKIQIKSMKQKIEFPEKYFLFFPEMFSCFSPPLHIYIFFKFSHPKK